MIVHAPEITKQDGEVIVSARIEMRTPVTGLPERFWYAFPEVYAPFVPRRADAFAAGALLIAMFFGEDMEVRAPVSMRLAYGLNEYSAAMMAWFPRVFKQVGLDMPLTGAKIDEGRPRVCASAFSGGVDSCYTLWSHLPANQSIPGMQPSHVIFIHGLDLRLYEKQKYESIKLHYREVLGRQGIELIPARTNGFLFWQYRTRWEWVYTPILMGAALCLGGLLSRFYVGSSEQYADLYPASSHPITDPLFSTETLEIVHHGCAARRIEKLEAISQWPVAYDVLRLCTSIDRRQGVENCCTCYKCMRARSLLAVLGSLEKFTTFPKPYSTLEILRLALDTHAAPNIPRQILRIAIKTRRWQFVMPALITFIIESLKQVLRPRLVALVPDELIYRWKARRYQRYAEEPETGLGA